MKDLVTIGIWVAIVGGVFAFLWWKGHLKQLSDYVLQTREELKKCTWPSWDELKGSTVVVAISIGILGGFTMVVDFVAGILVQWLT
jgi:preprotein translocase subunit SecE